MLSYMQEVHIEHKKLKSNGHQYRQSQHHKLLLWPINDPKKLRTKLTVWDRHSNICKYVLYLYNINIKSLCLKKQISSSGITQGTSPPNSHLISETDQTKLQLGGWFQIGDPFYSYMRYIVYIVYDNLKHPPFNKKNNKFTDTSIIKINCKTDWTKF